MTVSPDVLRKTAYALALVAVGLGIKRAFVKKKLTQEDGHGDRMLPKGTSAANVPAHGVVGVRLGQYFTLTEFVASATAREQEIDNTPTPEAIVAMRGLVTNVLDPLRIAVGRPITLTSGYRSPALNSAVGGAAASQHVAGADPTRGAGADIKVSGITPERLAALVVQLGLPFDQLLTYDNTGHLHVSWSVRQRRETKRRVAGNYVPWAPPAGPVMV